MGGGYGALELARVYPKLFAALCISSGHYEPCSAERLARLVTSLRSAEFPIWFFHGRDDDVCVFAEVDELVRLLREPQARTSPQMDVRLITEGISGHDGWSVAYAQGSGVFDWMLSQERAFSGLVPPPVDPPEKVGVCS